MTDHPIFRRMLAFVAAAPLLGTAHAAEPTGHQDAVEAARGTPVNVAGLRVFIDPATGRLRPPTDTEAAALASAMESAYAQRPVENAPTVHHADGSVSIRLGTRHLLHSVARVADDGTVETMCVQGAEAASDLLAGPADDRDAEGVGQ